MSILKGTLPAYSSSSSSSTTTLPPVKSEHGERKTRWGDKPAATAASAAMNVDHTPADESDFYKSAFSTADAKSHIANIDRKLYSPPSTAAAASPYPSHAATMKDFKPDPSTHAGASFKAARRTSPIPSKYSDPPIKKENKGEWKPVVVGRDDAEEISSDEDNTHTARPQEPEDLDSRSLAEQMNLLGLGTVVQSQKNEEGVIKFAAESEYESSFPNVQKYIDTNPDLLTMVPLKTPFHLANVNRVLNLKKHDRYNEAVLQKRNVFPKRPVPITVYHVNSEIIRASKGKVKLIHTLCVKADIWFMLFPIRGDWYNDMSTIPDLKSVNRYFWVAKGQDGGSEKYVSFNAFFIGAFGAFDMSPSAGSIGKFGKDGSIKSQNEKPRILMAKIAKAICNYMSGQQTVLSNLEIQFYLKNHSSGNNSEQTAQLLAELERVKAENTGLRQELAMTQTREAKLIQQCGAVYKRVDFIRAQSEKGNPQVAKYISDTYDQNQLFTKLAQEILLKK
jgi:hypothetical protein